MSCHRVIITASQHISCVMSPSHNHNLSAHHLCRVTKSQSQLLSTSPVSCHQVIITASQHITCVNVMSPSHNHSFSAHHNLCHHLCRVTKSQSQLLRTSSLCHVTKSQSQLLSTSPMSPSHVSCHQVTITASQHITCVNVMSPSHNHSFSSAHHLCHDTKS